MASEPLDIPFSSFTEKDSLNIDDYLVGLDTEQTDPDLKNIKTPVMSILSIVNTNAQLAGLSQVDNLVTSLAGKAATTGSNATGTWPINISGNAATVTNSSVQIGESQVTNLTTDLAARLQLGGGTMTGLLTLSGAPTTLLQAATKAYVDSERVSNYIVGPSAPYAYTTIQSAITAAVAAGASASAPALIIIIAGTYTENLTLANGVYFSSVGPTELVTIIGNSVFSPTIANSVFSATGISFYPRASGGGNGAIQIEGSTVCTVHLRECANYSTAHGFAFYFQNANATVINTNCKIQGFTGVVTFNLNGGNIININCNVQGVDTQSVVNAGSMVFHGGRVNDSFNISDTASCDIYDANCTVITTNALFVIAAGGSATIFNSSVNCNSASGYWATGSAGGLFTYSNIVATLGLAVSVNPVLTISTQTTLMNSLSLNGGTTILETLPHVNSITSGYTVLPADNLATILVNSGVPINITVPQQSTSSLNPAFSFKVVNIGVGSVTILKQGADYLLGNTTVNQYGTLKVTLDVAATPNIWSCDGGVSTVEIQPFSMVITPTLTATNYICANLPQSYTFTGAYFVCDSGTATGVLKINGTAITGGSLSLTSSLQSVPLTANNVNAIGQALQVDWTAVTACVNAQLTITGFYNI